MIWENPLCYKTLLYTLARDIDKMSLPIKILIIKYFVTLRENFNKILKIDSVIIVKIKKSKVVAVFSKYLVNYILCV